MAVLLIDFGVFVMIWMVQLIVYPSFQYYEVSDLLSWHTKYTGLISLVVIPLMFAQLGLHSYQTWSNPNLITVLALLTVLACWLITFIWAAPFHGKIAANIEPMSYVHQLIRVNWSRTVLWTITLIISLIQHYKSLLQ